jgi:CRP-like cAMP-binding protein
MKLRARDTISAREEAAIRDAVQDTITARAKSVVVRNHERLEASMILLSGIAARRKDMRDGRGLITELHVAGDFTDLHSFTLKYLDHDVVALTDCKFAIIPHERLEAITEKMPHLARVYWFATNLDAAIHREWELSLGRRDATARMAQLFCELYVRLRIVGLADNCSFDFPLTQETLAETLGLTAVHVNRTLQLLRSQGAVQVERSRVTIHDWQALQATAEFDPSYLYLDRRSVIQSQMVGVAGPVASE